MKLSTAVDQYLADCRIRGLSAQTLTGYRSDLGMLVSLASVDAADSVLAFTPELARAYFLRLSGKNLSMGTLHRRRSCLSEFAKWGRKRRYWLESPMDDLPTIKRPKHLPRPFSRAELEALLASQATEVAPEGEESKEPCPECGGKGCPACIQEE